MSGRKLKHPALVLTLAAALYLAVLRREPAASAEDPLPEGQISAVSGLENGQSVNNGYPALLRDRQGRLWCVWLSTRLRQADFRSHQAPYQEGDMVMLRVRGSDGWSPELVLNTNYGVNFAPTLTLDSAGEVVVVWSSRRQGQDGIWWRRVRPDLSAAGELRVPPAGTLETAPALATTGDGAVWLAFQSFRNGSADIVLYRLEGSGWRRMPDAAASADPEFRPRLAAAPDGGLWCAWDAYSRGKYRVLVRRFDSARGVWGTAEEVPGAVRLDAYAPDLAVDPDGRVWVVYARNEVEEPAWGLRGPKAGPKPRPTVRVLVRDRNGSWHYPGALADVSGRLAEGDLPRVAACQDGSMWVVWQSLPSHVDWKVGAALFRGKRLVGPHLFGRAEPVPLDGPPRRADQRPAPAVDEQCQLSFAYERGRGPFRNRDVYLRETKLRESPEPGAPTLAALGEADLRQETRPARRAPKRLPIHTVRGERLQLYFGDLHNHLLVDDGHQGSVDQLFAFHRDRFASDFAATTSHGDSNKLLISELAHNGLLTETMHAPGSFVAILGFEWTQGDFVVPRAGHRHVIYETPDGPLYRPTEAISDSLREFVDLISKTNGLLFAHHVSRAYAGGTDWSYVNVRVEPAVEVCSSWGRFEYYRNPGHIRAPEMRNCSVQDAWRMGWRLGVIGGSDGHDLFCDRIQGLTGIYARELTRAAIFEALRRRRCYATTGEPIVVEFRVNGHLMGEEITADEGPVVEAVVEGTRRLLAVEVIKRVGQQFVPVHRAPVEGTRATVWWKDPDFRESTLYYLRVTQEVDPAVAARYAGQRDNPFPTEMAWTSPVWVDRR